MLQTFYELNLKPKTVIELKGALQPIRDNLPQTFAISRLAVDIDIHGYIHGYYAGTFFN